MRSFFIFSIIVMSTLAMYSERPVKAEVPVSDALARTRLLSILEKLSDQFTQDSDISDRATTELRRHAEQGNVVATRNSVQNTNALSALGQNNYLGQQRSLNASIAIGNSNLAENACSFLTANASMGSLASASHDAFIRETAASDKALNGAIGTPYANGGNDAARLVAETLRPALCSADGHGGSMDAICTNEDENGHSYFSVGSQIFARPTITDDHMASIRYIEAITFHLTELENIRADVVARGGTDTKILLTEIDAAKARLSAAAAVYQDIVSRRRSLGTNARSTQYVRATLNGFIDPQLLDDTLPADGSAPSLFALTRAKALAAQNPDYFKTKMIGPDEKAMMGTLIAQNADIIYLLTELIEIKQRSAMVDAFALAEGSKQSVDNIQRSIARQNQDRVARNF